MKKFIFAIIISLIGCNGVIAQSLGKMALGCKRTEIPLSLPRGFNICKTNTSTQLTYITNKGDEYVSFYLNNNIVYKIVMHKYVGYDSNANNIESKLEELYMNLYEMWGEPYHTGENIYWIFPSSKATLSYAVSTKQIETDPLLLYGTSKFTTYYTCYADIKLEKRSNLFD